MVCRNNGAGRGCLSGSCSPGFVHVDAGAGGIVTYALSCLLLSLYTFILFVTGCIHVVCCVLSRSVCFVVSSVATGVEVCC